MAGSNMNEAVNASSRAGREAGKVELREYASGDEKEIVQILSRSHANGWGDEKFWRWKHVCRSGFVKEDVVVASVNNEMVGCFHGAVLPLTLEAGLEVPMNFEGDFAVLPEYRKLGIPDQAHDLISHRLLERGVMLRGGFTSKELNERFYHKRFGYIFVPTVTTQFRKILGLGLLQQKVEAYGKRLLAHSRVRQALNRQPLMLNLRLENFPPCHIEATEQFIRLREGSSLTSDLDVRLPYGTLGALVQDEVTLARSIILNFLIGRLRIRGLLRKGPRLLISLCLGAMSRQSS